MAERALTWSDYLAEAGPARRAVFLGDVVPPPSELPLLADDAPRPRDDDVVWTASEGSLEPERFTEAVRERALFPADCDLDEKRFAALRTAAAVEGVTPSTCHLSSELRNRTSRSSRRTT